MTKKRVVTKHINYITISPQHAGLLGTFNLLTPLVIITKRKTKQRIHREKG